VCVLFETSDFYRALIITFCLASCSFRALEYIHRLHIYIHTYIYAYSSAAVSAGVINGTVKVYVPLALDYLEKINR
jgi:hypothetical protein